MPARIIEIEWSVKNNKPFNPSPKKPRRSHSKPGHNKSSKRKHKSSPRCEVADEDAEYDEDEASGKENLDVRHRSPGKRRMKTEHMEVDTPPKKRRMLKYEE